MQELQNWRTQASVQQMDSANAQGKRRQDDADLIEHNTNAEWALQKRNKYSTETALWKQSNAVALLEVHFDVFVEYSSIPMTRMNSECRRGPKCVWLDAVLLAPHMIGLSRTLCFDFTQQIRTRGTLWMTTCCALAEAAALRAAHVAGAACKRHTRGWPFAALPGAGRCTPGCPPQPHSSPASINTGCQRCRTSHVPELWPFCNVTGHQPKHGEARGRCRGAAWTRC